VESRIAVIGASGQLGTDLVRLLGSRAIPLRHQQVELTDITNVRTVIADFAPSAVINAAAYNWVDKAEDEPHVAYAVNALGPRNLALVCSELNIPLLHVSSDYVFGEPSKGDAANPSPHRESEAPSPRGAYAVSKLAGEYFVLGACPKHIAVRTCGLYGRQRPTLHTHLDGEFGSSDHPASGGPKARSLSSDKQWRDHLVRLRSGDFPNRRINCRSGTDYYARVRREGTATCVQRAELRQGKSTGSHPARLAVCCRAIHFEAVAGSASSDDFIFDCAAH
jgi:nucleoside-diphosphate-sugar epimerase